MLCTLVDVGIDYSAGATVLTVSGFSVMSCFGFQPTDCACVLVNLLLSGTESLLNVHRRGVP